MSVEITKYITKEGRKLTRREMLKLLVVGVAGVSIGPVVAACVPARPVEEPTVAPTAAPAVPGKVRVLFNDQGDWNKPTQDFFDAWTKETGIESEWTFSPDWTQNFLTQFAAGNPPDILLTTGVGELAERGAFVELDELWAKEGIKREDFVAGMVEMVTYKDKIYAMPGGVDYNPLFWNKDAFEDAGLDPEVPPKTRDEMTEFADKLFKKDEQGNILRLGLDPTEFNEWYFYWAPTMGLDWWDAKNQKVTLNSPAAVELLEWMVENTKRWGGPRAVMEFRTGKPTKWDFETNILAIGEIAMMLNGWWMGAPFQKYFPDLKYGIALPPTLTGKPEEQANYPTGGWALAIAKGDEVNVEGAWSLLKYGFWEHAAEFSAASTNGCSVLGQLDRFGELAKATLKGTQMEPYFDVFTDYADLAKNVTYPSFPVSVYAEDQMSRAYSAAILGEKLAKEALDEAQAATEKELERVLSGGE